MKDAGRGTLLAALALGAAAFGLVLALSPVFRDGALSHEFCNYAEIGRNLLEGRGLVTRMTYPFTIALLDARGIPFDGTAPVLDRFPLQAVLSAAAQALLGRRDAALHALSAAQYAACAAAILAVGARVFGPWVAGLAAVLFAFDPSFVRGFVGWGQPDFGFCLLTLLATYLATAGRGAPSWRWALAGAVAGLAWLQRSNFILWLPLFAWPLGVFAGERRRPAWFAAGFLLAAAPALAYNLRWYGAPTPPTFSWNLAHHVVVDTPPWLSYRVFDAWDTVGGHLPALGRKFVRYFWLHLRDLPTWWQGHLLFPAAAWGFWTLGPGRARDWMRLYALMLAVQIPVFSLLRFETLGPYVGGRYYLWLAPALFLLAARGAAEAGRRLSRPVAIPALFGAANLAFFALWLLRPQGAPTHPQRLPLAEWPELAAAAELAGERGLVATNLPGQLAWYGRRAAVALPVDPDHLAELDTRHPVAAVLVTRLPLGELAHTPAWRAVLDDPEVRKRFYARTRFRAVRDFGTSTLFAPDGR